MGGEKITRNAQLGQQAMNLLSQRADVISVIGPTLSKKAQGKRCEKSLYG